MKAVSQGTPASAEPNTQNRADLLDLSLIPPEDFIVNQPDVTVTFEHYVRPQRKTIVLAPPSEVRNLPVRRFQVDFVEARIAFAEQLQQRMEIDVVSIRTQIGAVFFRHARKQRVDVAPCYRLQERLVCVQWVFDAYGPVRHELPRSRRMIG
jgi:hypothetical protein